MNIAFGEGRQERHLMRQRGAGAREITANFGFVFRAGPVQLQNPESQAAVHSTSIQAPVHSAASERILEPEQDTDILATKENKEIDGAREKRPKLNHESTNSPDRAPPIPEQSGNDAITRFSPTIVKDSVPTTKKPARKVPAKKSTKPKPQQKRHAAEELQIQEGNTNDGPIQQLSPKQARKVKAVAKPKSAVTATATKRSKAKINKAEPEDSEDELSNDSLPAITSPKPTKQNIRRAEIVASEEPHADATAPKKKTRVVSRKRENVIVEEPAEEKAQKIDVEQVQPARKRKRSAKDETTSHYSGGYAGSGGQHIHESEPVKPTKKETLEPQVGRGRKRKVVQQTPERSNDEENTPISQSNEPTRGPEIDVEDQDKRPVVKETPEPTVAPTRRKRARKASVTEAKQPEVVSSCEIESLQTATDKVISEPVSKVTRKPRRGKEAKSIEEDVEPIKADDQADVGTAETKKRPKGTRTKKPKPATSRPVETLPREHQQEQTIEEEPAPTPQEPTQCLKRTQRQPLAERNSNSSPQKPIADFEEQQNLGKQPKKGKRTTSKRPGKNTTQVLEEAVSDSPLRATPAPTQAIIPEVSVADNLPAPNDKANPPEKQEMIPSKPVSRSKPSKKAAVYEEDELKPKNKKTKSSTPETRDLDMALFDTEAPAFMARKAPKKTVKRVFNDDDEFDLDQMLDGIAAIAGNGNNTAMASSTVKSASAKARSTRGLRG